jgi:group I intron endonuclease
MREKLCGIYEIINVINDHSYIGQSIDIEGRKNQHFNILGRGKHHNPHLQYAFNEYGEENFVFEILFLCDPEDLTLYEQMFVDEFKPVYNIWRLCVDSHKGISPSEETRQKLSIINMGKHASDETKQKMSKAHDGKSSWNKGKSSWNKGTPRTEESKKKQSIAMSGRPHIPLSEQGIKNLSDAVKKSWVARKAIAQNKSD